EGDSGKYKRVASPRPGHADLAGALKYNFSEARYVLERASARESAARVAIGGLAKLFLCELGIEVLSHVVAVGCATIKAEVSWSDIRALSQNNEILLNCAHTEAEQRMKEEVDKVLKTGDSVGGVFEVVAHNVPPGLGTYAQWDERLDGLLGGAVMSLQAVKAVEIATREPVKAAYERSDVCVVPAAGVAGEAMVALTLARCALEKFGGDSMPETLRNFKSYLDQLRSY